MRRILHIVTKSGDDLSRAVIKQQMRVDTHAVESIDLTQANPDYESLVRKIFEADSIEVW